MSRKWIDYQNIHLDGTYNKTIVRLKEEELDYLKRITVALEKLVKEWLMEKQMTPKEIDNAIYQLGVLLADEMTGLIITTMQQNFYEKYKRFDLMIAWDCFVDEINRVETVIQLHDYLAENIEEIKQIGENDND